MPSDGQEACLRDRPQSADHAFLPPAAHQQHSYSSSTSTFVLTGHTESAPLQQPAARDLEAGLHDAHESAFGSVHHITQSKPGQTSVGEAPDSRSLDAMEDEHDIREAERQLQEAQDRRLPVQADFGARPTVVTTAPRPVVTAEERCAVTIQAHFRGYLVRKARALPPPPGPQESSAAAPEIDMLPSMRLQADTAPRGHQLQQQALTLIEWDAFARAARQNHLPLKPCGTRRTLDYSSGYRLCVNGLIANQKDLRAMCVPLPASARCELRLLATLYDGHTASLYGTQCFSLPQEVSAATGDSGHVPFAFDVYWHSRIADPKTSLLLQVLVSHRADDGVLVNECSVAWARIPLAQELVAAKVHRDGPFAGLAAAQLYGGSARYLLLAEGPYAHIAKQNGLSPPTPFGSCEVVYGFESFPALEPALLLLREDQLVSYDSVVPGLVRYDLDGNATVALRDTQTALAQPVMMPTKSITLRGVSILLDDAVSSRLCKAREGPLQPDELARLDRQYGPPVPKGTSSPHGDSQVFGPSAQRSWPTARWTPTNMARSRSPSPMRDVRERPGGTLQRGTRANADGSPGGRGRGLEPHTGSPTKRGRSWNPFGRSTKRDGGGAARNTSSPHSTQTGDGGVSAGLVTSGALPSAAAGIQASQVSQLPTSTAASTQSAAATGHADSGSQGATDSGRKGRFGIFGRTRNSSRPRTDSATADDSASQQPSRRMRSLSPFSWGRGKRAGGAAASQPADDARATVTEPEAFAANQLVWFLGPDGQWGAAVILAVDDSVQPAEYQVGLNGKVHAAGAAAIRSRSTPIASAAANAAPSGSGDSTSAAAAEAAPSAAPPRRARSRWGDRGEAGDISPDAGTERGKSPGRRRWFGLAGRSKSPHMPRDAVPASAPAQPSPAPAASTETADSASAAGGASRTSSLQQEPQQLSASSSAAEAPPGQSAGAPDKAQAHQNIAEGLLPRGASLCAHSTDADVWIPRVGSFSSHSTHSDTSLRFDWGACEDTVVLASSMRRQRRQRRAAAAAVATSMTSLIVNSGTVAIRRTGQPIAESTERSVRFSADTPAAAQESPKAGAAAVCADASPKIGALRQPQAAPAPADGRKPLSPITLVPSAEAGLANAASMNSVASPSWLKRAPSAFASSDLRPESPPKAAATRGSARSVNFAQDADPAFIVRVSVHNGNRIVGPSAVLRPLQLQHMEWDGGHGSACRGAVLQTDEAVTLDWVPEDHCVVLFVELLMLPSWQAAAAWKESLAGATVVGWTAVAPFSRVAPLSGSSINDAQLSLTFAAGPGVDPLSRPLLSWRDMMGDVDERVPAPTMQAALRWSGRPGMVPPFDGPRPVLETLPSPPAAAEPIAQEAAPAERPAEPSLEPRHEPAPGERQDEQPEAGQQPKLAPELQQLKSDMQKQHEELRRHNEMLTKALLDLQKGQELMATRLLANPLAVTASDASLASTVPQDHDRQHGAASPPVDESLDIFKRASPDGHPDSAAAHAGAPASLIRDRTGAPSGSMTRAQRARLHATGALANLPPAAQALLLGHGAPVPRRTPIRLDLERQDPRTVSDVIVQFISFTPHDALNAPHALDSLYMRFQMFDFQPTKTPRIVLEKLGAAIPSDRSGHARATHLLRAANEPSSGAGFFLKYCVDGAAEFEMLRVLDPAGDFAEDPIKLLRSRHVQFADYCAYRRLSVDLFDASSSLQFGTASVDLQGLLRQGRDFADCVLEVPVMDNHEAMTVQQSGLPARSTLLRPGQQAPDGSSACVSRGSLQVRLINIGREPENMKELLAAAPRPPKTAASGPLRVRSRALIDSDTPYVSELVPSACSSPDLLLAPRRHSESSGTRAASPGVGPGAAPGRPGAFAGAADRRPLSAHPALRNLGELRRAVMFEQRKKVLREERLQQLGKLAWMPAADEELGEAEQTKSQARLLADVESLRRRHKHAVVQQMLEGATVRRHTVRAAYGELILLDDLEFSNPGTDTDTFRIEVDSPNILAAVNSTAEWRQLCAALNRDSGAVGDDDFLAGDLLLLQPLETVRLPFRLQLFPPHEASPMPDFAGAGPLESANSAVAVADGAATAAARGSVRVRVRMINKVTDEPVLVHEILVVTRRLVVDRTFRFYAPRSDVLRETIKLDALPGRESSFYSSTCDLKQLAVVSSHANIVLSTHCSNAASGEQDRVTIKAKSKGKTCQSDTFYITLYGDCKQARPLETWQVNVHWLRKHDISAIVGQTNQGSVVLKGMAGVNRSVSLFSSHPDELNVSPQRCLLPAATNVEVLLNFRPLATGSLNVVINIVDQASGEFIDALLVATHARPPSVSKMFEVELPAGTLVHKKVAYRNMYHQRRVFKLRSSHPHLVKFTQCEVDIPALQDKNLGIQIDARHETTGMTDTLVFINDEEDRNEECYKIRVHVYRPESPTR